MADTTKLYNTYGDLYDTPQIIYSDYGQPEEISPDTRIDSLEGLLYGNFQLENFRLGSSFFIKDF